MKKTLSVIITLALVLLAAASLLPLGSAAAWSGSRAERFAVGSGTGTDPYIIGTPEELALLADNINSGSTTYEGEYFKLNADIDLGGLPWEPIGNYVTKKEIFKGHFDGAGFTVSGLKVEVATDYAGLFGRIESATVENLHVKGALVSGAKYVGAVISYGVKSTNIFNCTSDVELVTGYVVGGIVGRIQSIGESGEYNQIKACFSSSNLRTIDKDSVFVGGIVGACGATVVSYCGNSGKVELAGAATTLGCAGGVVGVQGADNATSHIRNCYNTGDVSALMTVTTYAGGVVGRSAHIQDYIEMADVKNCFSTGSVIVKDTAGAAVDGRYGSVIGHVRYVATIANCYTNKAVTELPEVGTDAFASLESGAVTVLTDAQMKGADAVTAMKLGAAWTANASGYPTINAEAAMSAVETPEVTTAEEATTPPPAEITTPEPDKTTEAPAVTEPEPEITTQAEPGVTTAASGNDDDPSGNTDGARGGIIYPILIAVVVVLAAGAIVFVIISEKKKKPQ